MKLHPLVAAVAMAAGSLAAAQPTTPASGPTEARRQAAVEKWKEMTPEQKAEAKAKAKAKWDSMTPEQQAVAKQHFAEKHPQAAKRMEANHAAAAPAAPPAASAPTK